MLWLFLVTVTMLFAAFSSALIVSRSDSLSNGTWNGFEIPAAFYVSTVIIVISSISLQWSYFAARRNNLVLNRILLWITMILGISFVVSQCMGYRALIHENVYLSGNNLNGSYFYIISAIHALHLVGGVIFVLFTLISSYRYRVHSRSMLRINLCTTYWHFIGGLWVYLFILLNVFS